MTIAKLIEAVERARGLLPTYDRCEIGDGTTILLWNGPALVCRLSFDLWFQNAEPHHVEAIIGDLLDLFMARQSLREMDPAAILRALEGGRT